MQFMTSKPHQQPSTSTLHGGKAESNYPAMQSIRRRKGHSPETPPANTLSEYTYILHCQLPPSRALCAQLLGLAMEHAAWSEGLAAPAQLKETTVLPLLPSHALCAELLGSAMVPSYLKTAQSMLRGLKVRQPGPTEGDCCPTVFCGFAMWLYWESLIPTLLHPHLRLHTKNPPSS
jgi:hypothetical protein